MHVEISYEKHYLVLSILGDEAFALDCEAINNINAIYKDDSKQRSIEHRMYRQRLQVLQTAIMDLVTLQADLRKKKQDLP